MAVLDPTFADGLRGEVEVLARMRGPVFAQATTIAGFAASSSMLNRALALDATESDVAR